MKPRVLLVDDEPDLLELLTFNLLRRGFEVITASEGFEAIRSARREIPDVIVLDLMLPDIDGFSVAGKASKSTNWNHASAAFRRGKRKARQQWVHSKLFPSCEHHCE